MQYEILVGRSLETVRNFKHLERKQSSAFCLLVFKFPQNCNTLEISFVGHFTFIIHVVTLKPISYMRQTFMKSLSFRMTTQGVPESQGGYME